MKNNLFSKIVVALLFSVICAYFLSALLRTLIEKSKDVQGNILDYQGTYEFIMNTSTQNQFIVVILTACIFFFMLSKMNIKPNKYQDASDFGVHGTSRWGKFEEIIDGQALSKNNKFTKNNPVKSLKVDNGLILGKVPDKNELLIMPKNTSIDNRNVIVLGSSGSGKGQSYVLPNLINNSEETMIVTDPKGELYRDTAKLKRDQGYEVYQIDFINFLEGGYNPLDYVNDDQDAQQIAKTIAKNSAKDGKEDFFQVEGQRLLTALIIYCKHEYPNANIPDHVLSMFNKIADDENFLPNLLVELDKEHPAYQLLKSATVAQGKTRASILASFTQQTGIFTINKVAKMTRQSTFNFKEFQEKKSILYVKIPMDENPFLSLTATFFDQLISVFYRYADNNNSVLNIPTVFELDEFANIGKIEKYGRVLATCRGLGMSMNTIIQDVGQLEELYGKEMARSIISNHDTQIFLRTKDNDTAQYFSKMAGETTVRMKTKSTSQQGGIWTDKHSHSKSDQEQYVKRPLITEGELTTLPKDSSYVFVAGYYPFKTQKAWQFEIYGDLLSNYEKYRHKLFKNIQSTPHIENVETTEQTNLENLNRNNKEVDLEQVHHEPEHETNDIPTHNKETGEILSSIEIEYKEREEQQLHSIAEHEREDEKAYMNDVIKNDLHNESEQDVNEMADELEEIVNNPVYLDNQKEATSNFENIKANEFAISNLDLIHKVLTEDEQNNIDEDIQEDENSLPM